VEKQTVVDDRWCVRESSFRVPRSTKRSFWNRQKLDRHLGSIRRKRRLYITLHVQMDNNSFIPPTTLLIINLVRVVASISYAINSGYQSLGQLFGKLFFAFWVISHHYLSLKVLWVVIIQVNEKIQHIMIDIIFGTYQSITT